MQGTDLLRQGLEAWQNTGSKYSQPFLIGMLADAYHISRQSQAGLTTVAEALALLNQYDERWYEAELHRLKGELLLALSSNQASAAESCFHQALSIARQQSTKSWELRAATSLARLWQSQGKRQEAYELLALVYEWFTEGFDTADLVDAKQLLDDLA